MVIADNLAMITSGAWGNYESLPGNLLFANALLYTFQMYTDFSGYSDMAIGVGKLLGIKVAKNFNYPFFAHNVADIGVVGICRSLHGLLTMSLCL